MRPTISVDAPGGNATTNRIGRLGYAPAASVAGDCACATPAAVSNTKLHKYLFLFNIFSLVAAKAALARNAWRDYTSQRLLLLNERIQPLRIRVVIGGVGLPLPHHALVRCTRSILYAAPPLRPSGKFSQRINTGGTVAAAAA